MAGRKRGQGKKPTSPLPPQIWIIKDDISGELWGPQGWAFSPCDVWLFESLEQAETALAGDAGKRLGAVIEVYDTGK